MPFSDYPPMFVLPDSDEGREQARAFWREDASIDIEFCLRYEPARHPVFEDGDFAIPRTLRVCGNRERTGVRDRQWCYRCMAGHPYTFHYKEDAERLSDSAIRT